MLEAVGASHDPYGDAILGHQFGRRTTENVEPLIDLPVEKKTRIAGDLCALKINADGAVKFGPDGPSVFVTNRSNTPFHKIWLEKESQGGWGAWLSGNKVFCKIFRDFPQTHLLNLTLPPFCRKSIG